MSSAFQSRVSFSRLVCLQLYSVAILFFSRYKSCLLLNLFLNLGPAANNLPQTTSWMVSIFFHLLTPSSAAVRMSDQGIQLFTSTVTGLAAKAMTLNSPNLSTLNIPQWGTHVLDYHNHSHCDFLQFGWPLGQPNCPEVVDSVLATERLLGATCSPFSKNPLSVDLVTSPLHITQPLWETALSSLSVFPQ